MKKLLIITALGLFSQLTAASGDNIATGLTTKYGLDENVSRTFFNPDRAINYKVREVIQDGYAMFENFNYKESERLYGLAYHAHNAVDAGIITNSQKNVGNAYNYVLVLNGRFHDLKEQVGDLAAEVDTLGAMPIRNPETLKRYFKKLEKITTMANFVIDEIESIDEQILRLAETYGDPQNESYSNREKDAISEAMLYQVQALNVTKKAIVGLKHPYNEFLSGQSSMHVKTMMPDQWHLFHRL